MMTTPLRVVIIHTVINCLVWFLLVSVHPHDSVTNVVTGCTMRVLPLEGDWKGDWEHTGCCLSCVINVIAGCMTRGLPLEGRR